MSNIFLTVLLTIIQMKNKYFKKKLLIYFSLIKIMNIYVKHFLNKNIDKKIIKKFLDPHFFYIFPTKVNALSTLFSSIMHNQSSFFSSCTEYVSLDDVEKA